MAIYFKLLDHPVVSRVKIRITVLVTHSLLSIKLLFGSHEDVAKFQELDEDEIQTIISFKYIWLIFFT
jgi:hypothetical protein